MPAFIRLFSAVHSILVQNITLMRGIKAVLRASTRVGISALWMAAFADVEASLPVLGNGLYLSRT
ncbi:hypothetical protein PQR25_19425 [Paraburkholderia nemoris]|uniref:hypothetical protein n=1 Tax=Paraburkholderia nemoris TaxID=2793076 RepID=UPI0038BC08C0